MWSGISQGVDAKGQSSSSWALGIVKKGLALVNIFQGILGKDHQVTAAKSLLLVALIPSPKERPTFLVQGQDIPQGGGSVFYPPGYKVCSLSCVPIPQWTGGSAGPSALL